MKRFLLVSLLFTILLLPTIALTQQEYNDLISGIDQLDGQIDQEIAEVQDDWQYRTESWVDDTIGFSFDAQTIVVIAVAILSILIFSGWRGMKRAELWVDSRREKGRRRKHWLSDQAAQAGELLEKEKRIFTPEHQSLVGERDAVEHLTHLLEEVKSYDKVAADWIHDDAHDALKQALINLHRHTRVEQKLIEKHARGALDEFKTWIDSLEPRFLRSVKKAKDIPPSLRASYDSLQKRNPELLIKDLQTLEQLLSIEGAQDPQKTAKLLQDIIARFDRFYKATRQFEDELNRFEGEVKDIRGKKMKHFNIQERKDLIDSAQKHSRILTELYDERLKMLRDLEHLLPRFQEVVRHLEKSELPEALQEVVDAYDLYNYLETRKKLVSLGDDLSLQPVCLQQVTALDNAFPQQVLFRAKHKPEQKQKLLELVIDVMSKEPQLESRLDPVKQELETTS